MNDLHAFFFIPKSLFLLQFSYHAQNFKLHLRNFTLYNRYNSISGEMGRSEPYPRRKGGGSCSTAGQGLQRSWLFLRGNFITFLFFLEFHQIFYQLLSDSGFLLIQSLYVCMLGLDWSHYLFLFFFEREWSSVSVITEFKNLCSGFTFFFSWFSRSY